MGLAGKFFCHMGKEYMHHGEVIEQVDDATVLLKLDGCPHKPPSMHRVSTTEMISTFAPEGSIDSDWEFFSSRAELDAWLKWLDELPDDDDVEDAPAAGIALN